MNKKVKWGIIVLVIGFLTVWGVYSQMPKQNKELAKAEVKPNKADGKKKALNVNAEIVKTGDLSDETTVTGILLPDEMVELSFETSGQVVDIMFKEGAHVKKGQLLAKVNDKKLKGELRRLSAQLKLANDRVDRQRTLLQHDAVSKEAYEQVNTDLATLKADIDIIKAQIELTELRAPFDGVIGLRQISVGAYATPQTIVSKLTKTIPLKVEFSVPERYANDIIPGTSLHFSVDGNMSAFPAKVYAKESSIDVGTHSLTVRALYANTNGKMTPGRYASIKLQKQKIRNAIAIPSEAVIPEMGKDKVFICKSGKAQPKEIKIGLRTEDKVQVIKGLSPGDTLITSGTLQLRTDLPVIIDNIK